MENVILIYIVIQSLTTAIGLFFIYSTQARVNEEILKRNYKLANKNSLYNFNEGLSNVFKGFIPFYYFFKGLNIIRDNGDFQNTVNKAIASGKYEPINFEKTNIVKETPKIVPEGKIEFEKVNEKFKAIKNSDNIYNPDETPIEYIEKIIENENQELTPYSDKINNEIINIDSRAISLNDFINFIDTLTPIQLEELSNDIERIRLTKQVTYKRILEKDIA